MYEIKEVKYTDSDFINLCKKIDDFQNRLIKERIKWGMSSLNEINLLEKILLMYYDNKAVSSAAIRKVNDDTAELCSICTDENYRRQGLSEKLIKEIIKYCCKQNYKKLILYTLKGSDEAISLYTKLGFIESKLEEREEDSEHMSYLDIDILNEIDKYTIYMEKILKD